MLEQKNRLHHFTTSYYNLEKRKGGAEKKRKYFVSIIKFYIPVTADSNKLQTQQHPSLQSRDPSRAAHT